MDQWGGRTMADTTSLWLVELLELVKYTGDAALLADLWPNAVAAIKWQIGACGALGLPKNLVCTYDSASHHAPLARAGPALYEGVCHPCKNARVCLFPAASPRH